MSRPSKAFIRAYRIATWAEVTAFLALAVLVALDIFL